MPDPSDESPPQTSAEDVTALLRAAQSGDRKAASELLPLVYAELQRLAQSRMAKLPPGQTIQATALVHEVYLRLVGDDQEAWSGRGHFFGAAAVAMRDILVEQARRKSRLKHGGGRKRAEMADEVLPIIECEVPAEELISLDAALEKLRVEHPRPAEVVLLRYFAGLSAPQVAEAMELSDRTVERDWRFAKAWLHKSIAGASESDAPDAS